MTKTPDELLSLRMGRATVGENLRRAIEAGDIIENEDGTLQLRSSDRSGSSWAGVPGGPRPNCTFLMRFLHRKVYAQAAVPYGCRACYKVKVLPRTLRELVAAWGIGKRIECYSKWGVDLNNPYSQSVYAGYFYTTGLDAARAVFKVAREAIDADPVLGPGISMTIKRGCSDYEAVLGPSDQYEFAPELAELEAYLKARFRIRRRDEDLSFPLGHWIELAFRIGDDTYLDFTAGKRLRPKTVSYDP